TQFLRFSTALVGFRPFGNRSFSFNPRAASCLALFFSLACRAELFTTGRPRFAVFVITFFVFNYVIKLMHWVVVAKRLLKKFYTTRLWVKIYYNRFGIPQISPYHNN